MSTSRRVDRAKRLSAAMTLHALLGLAAMTAVPAPGFSAEYPDRPIRLVVPFAPGGVNDVVGRLWADEMKTRLGAVVIENQGGGGGSVAAAAIARGAPDGYTILLGGGATLVVNPLTATRAAYDPLRDFAPIAILCVAATGIAVTPPLPAQDLKGFFAYARSRPNDLSYGSAGTGTIAHLAGELMKREADLPGLTHVPYKGATPALTDLISGHIPVAVINITEQILDFHKAGKIRILAVTPPRRLSAAPDLPTAAEQGYPGIVAQNFTGLFAPAGTSAAAIAKVAAATGDAMAQNEVRRTLTASGCEPVERDDPNGAKRFLSGEIARWTPVVKVLGLKAE